MTKNDRYRPHARAATWYTGELFDPEAAVAAGLLDEVVDPSEVEARAMAEAERLLAVPESAFGAMKATRPEKDTATPDSVKAKWPKDTLVTKLKESFDFCEKAFAQLDDAKLADQVTMTFGGQSRPTPRAGMVLGHVVDMADHYSQIANYMRLNNMIPPTALPRPGQGRE